MGYVKLDREETVKLKKFVKEQHEYLGNDFDDAKAAEGVKEILPGKDISAGYVAKVRKAIGIKLPRGSRKVKGPAQDGKASRLPKKGDQEMFAERESTARLQDALSVLLAKRTRLDAAIAKVEESILVVQGIL